MSDKIDLKTTLIVKYIEDLSTKNNNKKELID